MRLTLAVVVLVFAFVPLPMTAISADVDLQQPSAVTQTESFFFRPEDFIAVTHNGKAFLAAAPEAVALLTEPRIERGLVVATKIRDTQGEVIGFASELEVFPGEGAVFGGEELLVWETVWTVTIPGRGTLFLHQQEQENRQVTEEVIVPVIESGGSWEGEIEFRTSVGPGPGGYGVIVGGTEDFAGANGCFLEVNRITRFSADGDLHLVGELRIAPEC